MIDIANRRGHLSDQSTTCLADLEHIQHADETVLILPRPVLDEPRDVNGTLLWTDTGHLAVSWQARLGSLPGTRPPTPEIPTQPYPHARACPSQLVDLGALQPTNQPRQPVRDMSIF